MANELAGYTDEELIELYTADPTGKEGRVANAVLQYRQYRVTKRNNMLLVIVTAVLTVGTLVQAGAAVVQAYVACASLAAGQVTTRSAETSAKAPTTPRNNSR